MAFKFGFTGLAQVYREAYLRHDPTLAFELQNGRGRFVFLVFFSEEDTDVQDRLYLFLMGTQNLRQFKMYGSRRNGVFNIFVNEWDEQAIRNELQLRGGHGGTLFDLGRLLGELNAAIPATLPLRQRIETLRKVWPHVRNDLRHVVEDAEKTVLIGWRKLEEGKKPQEKTLRKLYLFRAENPDIIEDIISQLKKKRRTLAWTTPDPNRPEKSWANIFHDL